jgi:hypothetical protein
MSQRYPAQQAARLALAPGILAAIVLLAAVALVGTDWFTIARYVISILAAICCVFAVQGKQWWWIVGYAPIVVLWNPLFPIDLALLPWQIAHLIAAAVFVVGGFRIRVAQKDDQAQRGGRR